VEQQQEMHQQQDEHDRLGVAGPRALNGYQTPSPGPHTAYLRGYSLKEVGAFLGISPCSGQNAAYTALATNPG